MLLYAVTNILLNHHGLSVFIKRALNMGNSLTVANTNLMKTC